MKKIVAVAALVASGLAQAQIENVNIVMQCDTMEKVAGLLQQFEETPMLVADSVLKMPGGKDAMAKGAFLLTVSPSGTFSVLFAHPNVPDKICIVNHGSGLKPYKGKEDQAL